jgi:hypothetical protein
MDAFIRRYQNFIVSLLFMLAAVFALVYSALISPAQVASADMAALFDIIRKENAALMTIENKMKDNAKAGSEEVIQRLPDFLIRINAIANATQVIVRELVPSQGGNIKFTIKITTDFYTFIKFIQRLESLDVAINDMQIRPYDNTKKLPLHAIEFSITPRHDAREIKSERIAALATAVETAGLRNPFQRFVYDPNTVVSTEIDLTWIYRLSGIGQVGDARVATIDNKDYRKDDQLGDMTITAVDSDRVKLTRKTEHGTDLYVLKFRLSGLRKP